MTDEAAPSRLTLNDVATASGVSKATVSQVLRNTGRISPETRRHVLDTVKRIGYVYNRSAANLRAGRSTIVGIGISSLVNPFFADLVEGASEVLEAEQYFPMVVALDDDLKRQDRFGVTMRETAAAGAILCPAPHTTADRIAQFAAGAERCVSVLRRPVPGMLDFVGVDNDAGIEMAVAHLTNLGHRDIGYIGGRPSSESRDARLASWARSLRDAGLNHDAARTEACDATITAASQATARLLSRCPELTALVCHQDIVAFGASIGLHKVGRVPGQTFALVGFDDISMAADWDPPLTTVSVTPRELGAEAARLLLRRIAEPEAPLKSVFIQPKLIIRKST
ncbi:LacI family DNA-binding transcriptional regulator [Flavimaricola marinus]|uniref:Maltose regulon regulatory protein MalI n=1 Tax=Flavimaricola marinus TaxID=1819565 RepID=A0A238LJD7_9RHOB|nr:LacI family DNA-binding transcriptional regulator [Flavimaricola marinus]SMY09771.1 Maltose regulon regulatory protein MalI [Flavimaricola marinus]